MKPVCIVEPDGSRSDADIWDALIARDDQDGEFVELGDALRTLGGPGSGNFGHAGRPGEVGGSSSDVSSSDTSKDMRSVVDYMKANPDKYTPFQISEAEKFVKEQEQQDQKTEKPAAAPGSIRDHADKLAEELGFPKEKIILKDYSRRFDVGGREFSEGGHYDGKTGKITVNTALASTENQLGTVLSHEVVHDAFNTVHYWDLTHSREPKSAAYKEATELMRGPKSQDLIREDGVSQYSSAYWAKHSRETNIAEKGLAYRKAVSETLAEIGKYDFMKSRGIATTGRREPSPTWRSLYKNVRQAARDLKPRKK